MAKRKKKKLKKNVKIVLFVILLLLVGYFVYINFGDSFSSLKEKVDEFVDKEPKVDYDKLYSECIEATIYEEGSESEELVQDMEDLTSYLRNNYNVTIYYEDINTGFRYGYNTEKEYYAASTIKILDAVYIYQKAIAGEIDLEETVTYQSKHQRTPSLAMKKHSLGEKISLRDLVKYAITVSDNTAHTMLLEYIGYSTLKEFGLSLGATKTLYGGDNFGYINSADAFIYLKALNETINSDKRLGEELKSYFTSSDLNYLDIEEENILASTKYGEYDYFFHNIGIVYDKYPYYLVILSAEGYRNVEAIFEDINSEIYAIHTKYHASIEDACYKEVYPE